MHNEETIINKTVRTAFWNAIQKFSSIGINFIVTMLLARLLNPSDYGAIALLSVFFTIAVSISECGFRNALIRKDICTQADYSTAFFYNISVSSLLYVILFICSPLIADFYDLPILCPVMRVSGISLIISSINITQSVQLTRNLDFKKPALVSIITGLISGIAGILAAYLGAGIWALVIQGLTSAILNSTTLIYVVRWKPTFEISRESFCYLWNFGSKMLATGIISQLYANIYSIVIGKFYNSTILGLYNRGERSACLFPDIISGIFTSNTLPIMSQIKNNREYLIRVYRKYVVLVSFLNIPACLILAALAKPYIIFFLTEKWIGAVIYIQIFCMASLLNSANQINLNIFQVEGRSDITLKLEIIKKVIGFTIVFFLSRYNPLILAIGSACYSYFAYTINMYYANKLENLSYSQQLKDLSPCFLSGIVAAISAYLTTLFLSSPFFQLLIGGLMGLVVYIIMTKWIFKMEIYDHIDELIKRKTS